MAKKTSTTASGAMATGAMATPTIASAPKTTPAPVAAPAKSTPVRNSAIPKPSNPASPAPKPREVTHEMIARREYEISISGSGGSEFDNWIRAEKELKGS